MNHHGIITIGPGTCGNCPTEHREIILHNQAAQIVEGSGSCFPVAAMIARKNTRYGQSSTNGDQMS